MTQDTTKIPLASRERKGQTPAVAVNMLQHYYGEGELRKQVLFDNCLNVYPGEIVIMTGPSGSGKTTLLTLIGTLRTVQEGSLKVLDQELRGGDPELLIQTRRRLGFIFQAHNLFESLTAFQNVKMAMELFDFSPQETRQRIEGMLERLGLGHRVHYKPGSLSGGQKQRVAIARGLAHSPRIVLADEPTAALDEKSGREVVTLFQEMARQQGCTILMVTHDNRILDVADRIVNMVDGQIKSDVMVKESSVICEFLSRCSAFQGLTPRTYTQIADQMDLEEHPTAAVIIQQGDVGDKFYLIREGSVNVSIRDGDKSREVATLKEGEFFGEAALLTGERRNATVTAAEPVVLYTLDKDEFKAALEASDTFEQELRKALFERQ
ncbi:MAG: ATP-binding cassette domain-containing protein [Pirellulaceae bacterium]